MKDDSKEQEYAELHRRYEVIIETNPAGIVILDRNGNIKFANKRAEQMLGSEKDEITNRTYNSPVWKITDIDGNPFPDDKLPFCLVKKTGKPVYDVRHAIKTSDGCRAFLSINAAPLFNESGEFDGAIATVEDITKKINAENELKENEERFYQIIQQMPSPVEVCDPNGIITMVNPAFLDMFGISSQELVVGVCNVFDDPVVEELGLLDSVKKAYSKEPVFIPEITISLDKVSSKYGFEKWGDVIYEVTMFPVLHQSGDIWQVVIIWNDVTQRKQMEQALRESEERWQFALEGSGDGVWDWDIQSSKIFYSSRWKEMLGYKEDEFENDENNWYETIHPQDREMVRQEIAKHLEGKTSQYITEYRRICKDGTYKWILDRGRVITHTEDGKPLRMVGTHTDITARKRTEKALRESEEKYRLVVENANEIILVVQDGVFKFVNPKISDLMGYTADEMISKSFVDFIHPDDKAMVLENYHKRLRGEEVPRVYPMKVFDKNGDTKWIETSGVLIHWEGKPATLNFISDITEKRKMEEELFKAQKLESIGDLAGGIAHDFNNILTGILGNISLAKMFLDPKHRAYGRLTEAEKSSFRAKDLTQQLLTFSRGGAPVLETTSIAGILRDSASFALRGSNVKCEFSIPDDLYNVQVDEGQISQVINSIINNAEQSMPGGGTIKIEVDNVEIEEKGLLHLNVGKYVRISIADQGIGIPELNLPKIFDPYFTTKQKGSGLGLTIAYSIIKKHAGHIDVKSTLGVGTTFCIYLPAVTEELVSKENAVETSVNDILKILVVDDEEVIRDLAYQAFSNYGHEVVCVSEGAEAITLYKEAINSKRPFDIVIMDLTIPGGLGGKEAIARLLKIDPDVKVIVSSGYSNDPVMANYKNHGFKGVIVKPYNIRDLMNVLDEVLHN